MKIISDANESVLLILKKFIKMDRCTRWSHYIVQLNVDDGVLVFNTLTRELIHLTFDEFENYITLDYLKEHWFVVQENTNEKEYADLVRLVFTTRKKTDKEIAGYTIFPTTDCNARCFYCFELGRSRTPMSVETANKVVKYIKEHSRNTKIIITWFGGEPLFNLDAIETICSGLSACGIVFSSKMVSNGYLFNDEVVHRAAGKWNLRSVQITLDGTEKIYNKTKAYIYRDVNPYDIVMSNISKLLDAGIAVTIRLNMDLYNADDLLNLVNELGQRFSGKSNLSVYAHHLFDSNVSMAELHTDDEWEKRDVAMERLTNCIRCNGLASSAGITRNIKINYCKADSGNAVTILPDGSIGLCEHYSESEFIGNIDSCAFDVKMIESWNQKLPEVAECFDCFYYLDCVRLKKCPSQGACYRQFRQERLRDIQQRMLCTYENWNTTGPNNSDDVNFDC